MMISSFLVMIIMMIISLSLLALSFLILSITYVKLKCLISFRRNRRRLLDWYTELLSASPSQTIVVNRLGAPRTVVTANPANVEYVLKTNFTNFPKGRPFTDILGDLLGQGIFNVDGELWSTQRKLASHEFTARSLRELVAAVLEREVGESLVPLLEKACDGEEDDDGARVLDLQAVLRRFAFDVICRVSLGIEDGDACPVDLSRLVEAFDRAAEISAGRGTEPVFLVWKAKRALRVGSEKALREEVELIHKFVNEIIRQKRRALINDNRDGDRSKSRGGDLLSRLLLAGHGEEVVRDMVISFIMAGRDTTSAAMTWLFWLLSENAETERLAVEEVKRIMDKNRKNGDSTYALSYEGLQEMSYVKACLCEAMRLYPPVPWDSKHAANGDVLPDGTAVRRGDRVTYFPYGMGRMEEVWGKDCLEFRPDRWFSEPAAEDGGFVLKPVNPFRFPIFQAGPRVCLGKEMAFTQMKYVVASVLSRFEIRPVGLDRPVFVPLLTAHMAGGFKVSVRRRGGQ